MERDEPDETLKMLCAGSAGQLLNTVRLGADTGVSHNTVRAWLSVLEAGYVVRLLQPHSANFRKRLVKTPKLYFYDAGLLVRLLGVETPAQLRLLRSLPIAAAQGYLLGRPAAVPDQRSVDLDALESGGTSATSVTIETAPTGIGEFERLVALRQAARKSA